MSDLLIELFSEEIPARMQARARDVQEADDTKPDAQGNTATKAGQED